MATDCDRLFHKVTYCYRNARLLNFGTDCNRLLQIVTKIRLHGMSCILVYYSSHSMKNIDYRKKGKKKTLPSCIWGHSLTTCNATPPAKSKMALVIRPSNQLLQNMFLFNYSFYDDLKNPK